MFHPVACFARLCLQPDARYATGHPVAHQGTLMHDRWGAATRLCMQPDASYATGHLVAHQPPRCITYEMQLPGCATGCRLHFWTSDCGSGTITYEMQLPGCTSGWSDSYIPCCATRRCELYTIVQRDSLRATRLCNQTVWKLPVVQLVALNATSLCKCIIFTSVFRVTDQYETF